MGVRDGMRSNLSTVALKFLSAPKFAHVFGPEIHSEVTLAGPFSRYGRTYKVFRYIHRLTVKEKIVTMVAFATNQHVSEEALDLPTQYRQ